MTAAIADALVDWTHATNESVVALHVGGLDTVAILGADGLVRVVDLSSGGSIWEMHLPEGPLAAAWSPDGSRLAVGTTHGVHILKPGVGVLATIEGGWCAAVAWRPDGQALAAGLGRRAVIVGDGMVITWSATVASTVTGLAWLDRSLAVSAYGGISLFDPTRDRPPKVMSFKGSLLVLAVTPDGRWVATGNQDASLHAWRVGRSDDELTMQGYAAKVTALAFSPTGRFLASNGGSEVTLWDFSGKGPSGTTPRILSGCTDLVGSLAWSADGERLAAASRDGRVVVWRVDSALPGRPCPATTQFSRRADGATAVAWAGRERLLAAWSDGTLVLGTLPS